MNLKTYLVHRSTNVKLLLLLKFFKVSVIILFLKISFN
jgi:hypothetical protein